MNFANAIKTHVFSSKEIKVKMEMLEISITRFTRVEEDTEWIIPLHAHMNYELHYVYEGKGIIGLGNNVFNVEKGDYYICPPFIDHSQQADSRNPMKEYCIECSIIIRNFSDNEKEFSSFQQMLNRVPYCKQHDVNEVLCKNFLLLDQLYGKTGKLSESEELLAKSIFINTILNMLISSEKDNSLSGNFLDRNDIAYQRACGFKNYMEANYKQNITIRDCAKIFYLSERQIDRILINVFGETFHKLLVKTRVNIAMNLLKATDYSVEQVATEAGFSGYRQMLRSFKHFGVEQPTKIRKERTK